MTRECGRCGAMLDESEGICPTCGEVYGNQTLFQMPQITPEMLAADAAKYQNAGAAPQQPPAPRAAQPQPQPQPPAPQPQPPAPQPMRTQGAPQAPTATNHPMVGQAPHTAPASNKQFVVLLVMVLTGAMLIGVVVGLLVL